MIEKSPERITGIRPAARSLAASLASLVSFFGMATAEAKVTRTSGVSAPELVEPLSLAGIQAATSALSYLRGEPHTVRMLQFQMPVLARLEEQAKTEFDMMKMSIAGELPPTEAQLQRLILEVWANASVVEFSKAKEELRELRELIERLEVRYGLRDTPEVLVVQEIPGAGIKVAQDLLQRLGRIGVRQTSGVTMGSVKIRATREEGNDAPIYDDYKAAYIMILLEEQLEAERRASAPPKDGGREIL